MVEVKTFRQSELVLKVNRVYDTNRLDLSAWRPFIDRLCGDRVFQKEAIEAAIIYLASGQYNSLKDLAEYNYSQNVCLRDKYPSKKFNIDDVDIQNESLEDIIRGIYEEIADA